jgi:hypothetical protein
MIASNRDNADNDVLVAAFRRAALLLATDSPVPAARQHETTLALALLSHHPMRLDTLAELDIARHLQRDGKDWPVGFMIAGQELRIGAALELILSPPLRTRVDQHLQIFRPILLAGRSSTALFPSRNGTPVRTAALAKRLAAGRAELAGGALFPNKRNVRS